MVATYELLTAICSVEFTILKYPKTAEKLANSPIPVTVVPIGSGSMRPLAALVNAADVLKDVR